MWVMDATTTLRSFTSFFGKTALRRTTRDAVGLIVLSGLIAIAVADFGPLPSWLAPGLALGGLAVAVMCAIRLQLLEFAPEVIAGDVIVPRPSRAGRDVKLLLPLQFVNAGSVDGVIEWVALRLTIDGNIERSVLLSPVAGAACSGSIRRSRARTGPGLSPLPPSRFEARGALGKSW